MLQDIKALSVLRAGVPVILSQIKGFSGMAQIKILKRIFKFIKWQPKQYYAMPSKNSKLVLINNGPGLGNSLDRTMTVQYNYCDSAGDGGFVCEIRLYIKG